MNKPSPVIEILLLVVAAGIGIALYLSSSTNKLSSITLDAASRKVQSDIRYAKQLARENKVATGVAFNKDSTYIVYEESVDNAVIDPVTLEPLIVDISAFDGIKIENDRLVEFDPSGSPSRGYGEKIRLVTEDGSIRDVYVTKKTGSVVIDLVESGSGGCAILVP